MPNATLPLELTIPPRFSGPPDSANGGYACGRIAACADVPVTVTLRRPPPLGVPMAVERGGDHTLRVSQGGTLIAEATRSTAPPALGVPGPVSAAEARAAAGRSPYYRQPMFPGCFVCGPGRPPGDGLRIFPGPAGDRVLWAAPWTPDSSVAGPDGRVRPEVAWAALDCPSGIAVADDAALDGGTAIVLGRMTANLAALPAPGDPCVVVAWPAGADGRKLSAGSALLGPDGAVLAAASTVWITIPRPAQPVATGSAS
jgi:hypothetical protein